MICCVLFRTSFAQDATPSYYSKQIKAGEIKNFEFVLASDSLEGRETGRPGQKKAAAFISNHFRTLQLYPASHDRFYQDFPLKTEHVGNKGFEVNARRFQYTKDYYYPPGLADTLFPVDTLLFAGYGITGTEYDDYADINVNHRAVMIYEGEPTKKFDTLDLSRNLPTA